ncbi:hypothetical protein [Meiothermus sp.]|uniref:hypothetical protein n=1 Tax=Meiothermus sp. TaxID=1955249 RepID=UPI00307CD071
MINGRYYDWEHITINLKGRTLVDVKSINYGDERGAEKVYGKGLKPRGYRLNRYSGKDGQLTVLREEYDHMLEDSEIQQKGLYGIDPFEIVVSYDKGDGNPKTDVLQDCIFVERDFDNIEEDGDEMTVTLGFQYLGLQSNNQDALSE